MEDLRRSGRAKGKAVVEEPDDTINVEEEEMDDDFVDTAWDYSGLRRSQRNKGKELADEGEREKLESDNNEENEKRGSKRSRDKNMVKEIEKASGSNVGRVKKMKKETNTNKPGPSKPASKKVSSPGLQTRSSPKSLYLACSTLKPNQKACLEKIGFGGVIQFKMDGIPSRLGLYVVDNFNEKKKEIKLARGSLVLTKELIGEMLGIKNEGIDILASGEKRDAKMIEIWRKQYEGVNEIKPADVKFMIRNSKEADLNFKLNFVVLFTSLMGTIKQKGVCDLKILDYITADTNLSEINWCDYIWKCLSSCKSGWTKGKKDSYFCGPLTLLTLCYVDGTKCNTFSIGRKRPPTAVWTDELLSEREQAEVLAGGFGLGEVEEPFVAEEEDPTPEDIEGCVWMLKKYVKDINKERQGFEKTLDAALQMSAGDIDLNSLIETYIDSLKHTSFGNPSNDKEKMDIPKETEKDVHDEDGGASKHSIEDIMEEGSQIKRNEQGSDSRTGTVEMDEWGPLTQRLAVQLIDSAAVSGFDSPGAMIGPSTQEAFINAAADVDRSIQKTKSMKELEEGPSFSLGLTQDYETTNDNFVTPSAYKERRIFSPVPITVCPPKDEYNHVQREGKRQTKKPQIMRSPFVPRIVVVDTNYTTEESKLTKYLFLMTADDMSEVLFMSRCGKVLTREQLHDLGEEYVHNYMLDVWVAVMNYMEEYKSNDSPLRLFLPTYVVDKNNFTDDPYDKERLQTLVQHVEKAARNNNDFKNMKNIDIVFMPIDNDGHQFLLAFDIKCGSVIMFDQKKNAKNVRNPKTKKRRVINNVTVAEMLAADFSRYLFGISHPKAGYIINVEPEIVEFEGQSARFKNYAGMFVMRQMETYMGKGKSKWDWGLDGNQGKLQKQMVILKKKYAARILLSKCNLLMERVKNNIEKMAGEVTKIPLIKETAKAK